MIYTIYKITNLFNVKIYIGQTSNALEHRFNQHKHSADCRKLYNAFNKYGRENFKIEAICQTDNQEDADSLETFLIQSRDTIQNGYNLRTGGLSGHKPSDETRIKISQAKMGNKYGLGHKLSDENRVKLRNANLGRKASEETKAKLSLAHKDKSLSKEHRNAIGKAHEGLRYSKDKMKISEMTREQYNQYQRDGYISRKQKKVKNG